MSTIKLYRGDNYSYQITALDEDSVALDLTSASITFSVKSTVDAASYEFQCTTAGGDVVLVTPASGIFRVDIAPADTQSMTPGSYVWDAQITLSGGEVYTVPRTSSGDPEVGTFTVVAEVTRP